jgi:hypothetical protein
MVERYIRMVKEHQQEVPEELGHEVARLLLAYRASTHDSIWE